MSAGHRAWQTHYLAGNEWNPNFYPHETHWSPSLAYNPECHFYHTIWVSFHMRTHVPNFPSEMGPQYVFHPKYWQQCYNPWPESHTWWERWCWFWWAHFTSLLEAQKHHTAATKEAHAVLAKKTSGSCHTCLNCSKSGHTIEKCWKPDSSDGGEGARYNLKKEKDAIINLGPNANAIGGNPKSAVTQSTELGCIQETLPLSICNQIAYMMATGNTL